MPELPDTVQTLINDESLEVYDINLLVQLYYRLSKGNKPSMGDWQEIKRKVAIRAYKEHHALREVVANAEKRTGTIT